MMGYTLEFQIDGLDDAKRKWLKKHFGIFDFTWWEKPGAGFAKRMLKKDRAEMLAETARAAGFNPVLRYENCPTC